VDHEDTVTEAAGNNRHPILLGVGLFCLAFVVGVAAVAIGLIDSTRQHPWQAGVWIAIVSCSVGVATVVPLFLVVVGRKFPNAVYGRRPDSSA
jgi:hypothetical protein